MVYFFLFSLILISCTEKEDEDDDSKPSVVFADTLAGGKLEGTAVKFICGNSINVRDTAYITLFDTLYTNPCSKNHSDYMMEIAVPMVKGNHIAVYSSSFNHRAPYMALVNDLSAMCYYRIGQIKVSEIDSSAGVIRGAVYSTLDNNTFVNGTFEVPICNFIKSL